MTVTLMRHYRVRFRWKSRYTPEGFLDAQKEYDEADIEDQGMRLDNDSRKVIVSSLPRTARTLELCRGSCEHQETELLDEVPLAPFTDRQREYSVARLTFCARIQWLFNSARQAEGRNASRSRARRFIREFLTEDTDYLVIGHRFFFRILSRELRRCGFRGKAITFISNGERLVYRRG